ncbi:hypothetical protein EUTSA_v10002835mg, partial [Eutrema salsugineum]
LVAEAVAIRSALQDAIDLGLQKLYLVLDAAALTQAINQKKTLSEIHGILHDILNLSLCFEEIVFLFVPREANYLADNNSLRDF